MEDAQTQINNMDKRMVRLEDKVDVIDKRTDEMNKEMKAHNKEVAEKLQQNNLEVSDKLNQIALSMACLDEKFASRSEVDKKAGRWVEKVLWGAGAVIGTALLVAILDQVLRH